ncbi:MAG TPA: hypothetical protein VFW35_01575 [Sphingomicrobium sp.]|nr:hypothetical protein [Sphingomicrobium sp.]
MIDREYRLAEYSPRPPVNTAPHLQPPEVQLVRLNGERIAHERKKERLEEAITKCGAAVEVYKASVRKHEREKVIRPTMWPDWPDKLLDQAISAFTGAELRAPMWAQEFNRPEAAFDTWVGPMCERRQMFDPENNPRYLAKHRENLVIFEEALRDTKREAQNADHDVRRVKREIDQQAKRLG